MRFIPRTFFLQSHDFHCMTCSNLFSYSVKSELRYCLVASLLADLLEKNAFIVGDLVCNVGPPNNVVPIGSRAAGVDVMSKHSGL